MRRRHGWIAAALVAATFGGYLPSTRAGEPTAKDVADLIAQLQSPDLHIREAAAQSLGKIGAPAQTALPALTACVADAKLGIQGAAATAIGQIGVAAARPGSPGAHWSKDAGAGGAQPGETVPNSTKQTEGAVMWALRWLKNHQSPDGHWDCAGFDAVCKLNRCDGFGEATNNPGVSGLALLSFLGAGETHQSGSCRETVKNGLRYLRDIQDSDGCFGPRTHQHFMYNHACAALAMTEAYGMTGSKVFKEPAQRGIGFVLKAKNPYLAWRYNFPPDGDNDTSITGWMACALKSATMSEIDVDKTALNDAAAWVEKMTDPGTARTGYQQRGGPPARAKELMQKFPADQSESLTAVGVLVRIFAGHASNSDPMIQKGADLISKKPPRWDVEKGSIDFYYWYFGSLAMFQVGGDRWKAWNDAMMAAILQHQRMEVDRDERGSWDPVDPWSPQGGRIYSTALNCMCMEVYYRYGRVLDVIDRGSKDAPTAPAKAPVMSESLRAAVGALTDAAKSVVPEVRQAAETALDHLRAAYPSPAPPGGK